jgi:hypothetical protein
MAAVTQADNVFLNVFMDLFSCCRAEMSVLTIGRSNTNKVHSGFDFMAGFRLTSMLKQGHTLSPTFERAVARKPCQ